MRKFVKVAAILAFSLVVLAGVFFAGVYVGARMASGAYIKPDPETWFAKAEAAESPLDLQRFLYSGIPVMVEADPDRTAAILMKMPESHRETLVPRFAQSWAGIDPDAAFSWILSETKGPEMNGCLSKFTGAVAATDPARAAEFTNRMPQGGGRESAVSTVARAWAEKDVDATLVWVDSLSDFEKQQASRNLRRVFERADPERAIRYLAENGNLEPEDLKRRTASMVTSWAYRDPDACLEWARGSGNEENLAACAVGVGRYSFEEGLAAADEIGDEKLRMLSRGQIFSRFANKDPEEAFRRLMEMPESPETANWMFTMAMHWAIISTDEALEAIESLPAGPRRDHAAMALSRYFSGRLNFDSAQEWVENISDSDEREKYRKEVEESRRLNRKGA